MADVAAQKNMPTEAQIEQAARYLCVLEGVDPNEKTWAPIASWRGSPPMYFDGEMPKREPFWVGRARRIRDAFNLREALALLDEMQQPASAGFSLPERG